MASFPVLRIEEFRKLEPSDRDMLQTDGPIVSLDDGFY